MRSACVFVCKVQGVRPREMVVLAGDGVRSFFSEFSAGDARLRMRLSQNFSQPNGDRPVPIGQMWSDDRFPLNNAVISVALGRAEVDR